MTNITIPLIVFIILIVIAILFVLLCAFECWICVASFKIKSDYEKSQVEKYGTQPKDDNCSSKSDH